MNPGHTTRKCTKAPPRASLSAAAEGVCVCVSRWVRWRKLNSLFFFPNVVLFVLGEGTSVRSPPRPAGRTGAVGVVYVQAGAGMGLRQPAAASALGTSTCGTTCPSETSTPPSLSLVPRPAYAVLSLGRGGWVEEAEEKTLASNRGAWPLACVGDKATGLTCFVQ